MPHDPHHPTESYDFQENNEPAPVAFETVHNLAFSINEYAPREDGLTPEIKEGMAASGNLQPEAGSMVVQNPEADTVRDFEDVERSAAGDQNTGTPAT